MINVRRLVRLLDAVPPEAKKCVSRYRAAANRLV